MIDRHAESMKCLGEDCPDKRCEICYANRHMLDISDSYRKNVKGGYYTRTIMEITTKDGKKHYTYVRRGEDDD